MKQFVYFYDSNQSYAYSPRTLDLVIRIFGNTQPGEEDIDG